MWVQYLGRSAHHTFYFLTSSQMRKQTDLARTQVTKNRCMVCPRISMKDPTSVFTLCGSDKNCFLCFAFGVLGDPLSIASGQAGVEIAPKVQAERILIEWIPINSSFCANWLKSYAPVSDSWLKHRCLVIELGPLLRPKMSSDGIYPDHFLS